MSILELIQIFDGFVYEGCLFDWVDEEVVDQGVVFDICILMSCCGLFGLVGFGFGVVVFVVCVFVVFGGLVSLIVVLIGDVFEGVLGMIVEILDEMVGLYFGDGLNGFDVLEDFGIVWQDICLFIDGGVMVEGVLFMFELWIVDFVVGGVLFVGVVVYVWYCMVQGEYLMYFFGLEDVIYLCGVQVVDDDGRVLFMLIFFGCYFGCWLYIYFEVYLDVLLIMDFMLVIVIFQLVLLEQVCLVVYVESVYDGFVWNLLQIMFVSDNVFGDDVGVFQVVMVIGNVFDGYWVVFVVGVDMMMELVVGLVLSGGQGGIGGQLFC